MNTTRIIEENQLRIYKKRYPVEVNLELTAHEAREEAEITSWSPAMDKFEIKGEGIQEFNLALFRPKFDFLSFDDILEETERRNIQFARAEHLFAFIEQYHQIAVSMTKKGKCKILAPGTTWLDSHECLTEVLCVEWDPFYHSPGLLVSFEDDLNQVGMDSSAYNPSHLFLAIA